MNLIDEIKQHEGYRSHAYRDSVGVLTIGYGTNLDMGMSEKTAAKLLEWELEEVTSALPRIIPFWGKLSQARQEVFCNMGYNLGIAGLLGFRRMLTAAEKGNVESVCAEMKDSKWAKQVGARADYLIEKYRKG